MIINNEMNKRIKMRCGLLVVCFLVMASVAIAQEVKSLPYLAGWTTDLEDWHVADRQYTSKTWMWKAASTATITDSKKENDDWLISPALDCSGKAPKKITFKAAWNKAQSSNIALYYSLNYEGDQAAAEWVLVEEKIIPDSQPYGFKTDVFMPFSAKLKMDAPKVHFAIRYVKHNQSEEVQNEIRIKHFKVTSKK